jgi:hypothetical protein
MMIGDGANEVKFDGEMKRFRRCSRRTLMPIFLASGSSFFSSDTDSLHKARLTIALPRAHFDVGHQFSLPRPTVRGRDRSDPLWIAYAREVPVVLDALSVDRPEPIEECFVDVEGRILPPGVANRGYCERRD